METKSIMNSYDFRIFRETTICRLQSFLNSKNKNFLKSEITYSGARENDQGYLSSLENKNTAENKH